jgi:hypothetical protein
MKLKLLCVHHSKGQAIQTGTRQGCEWLTWIEQYKDEGESAIAGKQQGEEGQVPGNLLCQFEQILHDDPLMYVLFLHIITKAIKFFVFAVFFFYIQCSNFGVSSFPK